MQSASNRPAPTVEEQIKTLLREFGLGELKIVWGGDYVDIDVYEIALPDSVDPYAEVASAEPDVYAVLVHSEDDPRVRHEIAECGDLPTALAAVVADYFATRVAARARELDL